MARDRGLWLGNGEFMNGNGGSRLGMGVHELCHLPYGNFEWLDPV